MKKKSINSKDFVEVNRNDFNFLKQIADEQQISIEHVLSQAIELHIARHMYHCDLVVTTEQQVDPYDYNKGRKNFLH